MEQLQETDQKRERWTDETHETSDDRKNALME